MARGSLPFKAFTLPPLVPHPCRLRITFYGCGKELRASLQFWCGQFLDTTELADELTYLSICTGFGDSDPGWTTMFELCAEASVEAMKEPEVSMLFSVVFKHASSCSFHPLQGPGLLHLGREARHQERLGKDHRTRHTYVNLLHLFSTRTS